MTCLQHKLQAMRRYLELKLGPWKRPRRIRRSSVSSDAFLAPKEATASYLQHYGQDHARDLPARKREVFSSTNCDCDLPSCVLLSRSGPRNMLQWPRSCGASPFDFLPSRPKLFSTT